jgi:hypothetical protein
MIIFCSGLKIICIDKILRTKLLRQLMTFLTIQLLFDKLSHRGKMGTCDQEGNCDHLILVLILTLIGKKHNYAQYPPCKCKSLNNNTDSRVSFL